MIDYNFKTFLFISQKNFKFHWMFLQHVKTEFLIIITFHQETECFEPSVMTRHLRINPQKKKCFQQMSHWKIDIKIMIPLSLIPFILITPKLSPHLKEYPPPKQLCLNQMSTLSNVKFVQVKRTDTLNCWIIFSWKRQIFILYFKKSPHPRNTKRKN